MDGIKRRGFVAGILGFFGLTTAGKAEPQLVSYQEGTNLDLRIEGVNYRAKITNCVTWTEQAPGGHENRFVQLSLQCFDPDHGRGRAATGG